MNEPRTVMSVCADSLVSCYGEDYEPGTMSSVLHWELDNA